MGSWGAGIFQDDHALDFAGDLEEAQDPVAHLEGALDTFLSEVPDGYDVSSLAEEPQPIRQVLAAGEIIRAALSGEDPPRTLRTWLEETHFRPSQRAVDLAIKALDVLVSSEWFKADDRPLWETAVGLLSVLRTLATGR